MEIILKTVNTGIHSQITIDVESVESEFLPVLERITKIVEEVNDKADEEA